MFSICLDFVCLVDIGTIAKGVRYSFMISSKSGFHISGPSMFSLCSNHYNYDVMIYFIDGFNISGPSILCLCSNHKNLGEL